MSSSLTCGVNGLNSPQNKLPPIPLIIYIRSVRTVLQLKKKTNKKKNFSMCDYKGKSKGIKFLRSGH